MSYSGTFKAGNADKNVFGLFWQQQHRRVGTAVSAVQQSCDTLQQLLTLDQLFSTKHSSHSNEA
jgi:hypothetical protein